MTLADCCIFRVWHLSELAYLILRAQQTVHKIIKGIMGVFSRKYFRTKPSTSLGILKKNRYLFLTVSEARKLQIKAPAENLVSGLQMTVFSLCSHLVKGTGGEPFSLISSKALLPYEALSS